MRVYISEGITPEIPYQDKRVVPGCVKVNEFEKGTHLAVGMCVYECIFLSLRC